MAGIVEIFPRDPLGLNDDAVTNTAVDVKASELGGWLVGGNAYNPSTDDVAYLQFFNAVAADVTLGTTVPIYTIAIPAVTSLPLDPPRPIQFSAGMSYACTATMLGAGAPTSDCTMFLQYV